MKSWIRNLLALSLVLVGFTVQAAGTFKDWKTVEAEDAILKTLSCKASTEKLTGPIKGSLVVHLPKDQKFAPYITVQIPKVVGETLVRSVGIAINTKKVDRLLYFNAAPTETTDNNYWALPLQLLAQIDQIERLNTLNLIVETAEGVKQSTVSLSGSFAALQDAKKCAGYQPAYVQWLMEKPEVKPAPRTITLEELFIEYQDSSQKFAERKTLQGQLDTHKKTISVLVKQETDAKNLLVVRTNALNAATKVLSDHDAKILTAETRLTAATTEKQDLVTRQPLAEQNFTEKEKIYTPLKQGETKLIADYNVHYYGKQNLVSESGTLRQRISSNESELSQSRNEITRLSSDLVELNSRSRDAEYRYQQAQRDYDNYDVLNEIRRRHDSSGLRNAEAEVDRSRVEKDRTQRRLADDERDYQRVSHALQECRRNPNDNDGDRPGRDRGGDPGRGGGPGGGGPGGNGRPPRDCNELERKKHEAERRVNDARRDYADAERRTRDLEVRVQDLRQRLEHEVRNEKNNLQARKDQTYQAWSSARADIDRAQARLTSLQNSVVPNLESQIHSDRSRLNQVQGQIPGYDARIAQAQKDLDDYRARVNLKQAEKDFVDARNERDKVRTDIAARTQEIAGLQKTIPALTNQRAVYDKDRTAKLQLQEAATKTLTEIQVKLEPDRKKESELTALVDGITVDLKKRRDLLVAAFEQHWAVITPAALGMELP